MVIMIWNNLLIALVTATSLHRLSEPGNINYKLERLEKATKTGEIETPPLKGINTRAKAYGLSFAIVGITTLITYFLAGLFDPALKPTAIYCSVVLLLSDIVSMISIDKYHLNIEKLTKRLKK